MNNLLDVIIIGAGVNGLSIAKALSSKSLDVLVLEKEDNFGMGISSRNSEVIHAGIYNPPGFLKSSLCVSGNRKLYQYANARNIPHNACGKLIIASNKSELSRLESLKKNAEKCGVNDLELINADQCHKFEPDINAFAALHSPTSGIIDSHTYMMSLVADIENQNGQIVYRTEIIAIEKTTNGFSITTKNRDNETYTLSCCLLINAAGLGAMDIAQMIDALDKKHVPELHYAKGNYFSYSGKNAFHKLIYPLPAIGGLGIHLTLDMAGGIKFGPDVEHIKTQDYSVNPALKSEFAMAIKKYYPSLDEKKLHPSFAGIRPKLSPPIAGAPLLDFDIQFNSDHGIEGLVNLFGVESPGLTSSLAIGDYVVENLI